MTRDSRCHALILKSRPSGEAGLFRATVFGGPKSRLRSYASPFHSGLAWLYRNPVGDSCKLGDFDVRSWRPGLRESYARVTAADAVCETVLASHGGGGSWQSALDLAETALDGIARAEDRQCRPLFLRFLWQWADFLGIRPDFSRCSSCGAPLPENARLSFSTREAGMVCAACLRRDGPRLAPLVDTDPACRTWLRAQIAPETEVPGDIPAPAFAEANALATGVLTREFGRKPASWACV
ncbi:MAG: DNA repair protein RecO C-terminal domain-containing protein [Treponema sp.]|nr:DNA repair protein RecO C-terminal domain-containing protein [Treponema sp.]